MPRLRGPRLRSPRPDHGARQCIEQTPREQEDKFATVVDSLVDSVITIDHAGIIQSVNMAATRLFGHSAEEMIGSNVGMLMPAHHAREHARYIANYLTTGERKVLGQTCTLEAQRKDGTTSPMELSVMESTWLTVRRTARRRLVRQPGAEPRSRGIPGAVRAAGRGRRAAVQGGGRPIRRALTPAGNKSGES